MLVDIVQIENAKILPTKISISDETKLLGFLETALVSVDYALVMYARRSADNILSRYLYIVVDDTEEFKEMEMMCTLKYGHGVVGIAQYACNPFKRTRK